ncbi:hypothetical protein LPUS_11540 [Lasallia pustulata]|uniref:Uncharacterized protein n=1 Tax=Lasallia pustulata TaxID=136370 RepID=A0A1W5DCJ6_9LECA|nr:hypothetical protein LPUS_11540 [Lasallia pustulata]
MGQDDQIGRHLDPGRGNRAKEKAPASMAARIGASASTLLREGLLRANASSLASTLASSTASKGESSHSASASPESVLPFRPRAPDGVLSGEIPNSGGQSTKQESFRSRPWNTSNLAFSNQQDIDGFQSSSHSQLPASDNQLAHQSGVTWSTEDYPKFLNQPAGLPARNVAETLDKHVGADGDAVVALLSNPDFSVDDAPTDTFSISNENDSAIGLFTDTEFGVQDVQRYKSQLPDPPTHGVPSPTNPLNLIPDLASQRMNGVVGATSSLSTSTNSEEESYMYHFTHPQSTPDVLGPWTEVLSKYQDHVWGDMLPLVQQAREEIKEAKSGAGGALRDHPAVNRLRMILGHLDSSAMSSKTNNGIGHRLNQADGMLTGSLNNQFQPNITTRAGEQSLSTESMMQDHIIVGVQQSLRNQIESQYTSLQGSGQLNQVLGRKERRIDEARAERRALVEFDKAAAIREAQNRTTPAEYPEDPISDLEEEDHFVWYHRVDLSMSWADVKEAYDDHFPERAQEDFRNSQWNYYRCLGACGQTETKQSEKTAFPQEEYGMRARTGLWYPWIREILLGSPKARGQQQLKCLQQETTLQITATICSGVIEEQDQILYRRTGNSHI